MFSNEAHYFGGRRRSATLSTMAIVGIVIGGILGSLLLLAAASLIAAVIAQATWNMFAGYLKLGEIGYWQMFGLLMFLCTIKAVLSTKIETKNN